MSATIETLLSLLVTIVGGLSDSSAIANVISTLEQIISTGIQEVEDVAPIIKNIIVALQGNSSVTAAQMQQLQQLDAATDAAFEAAATAAGAPANPSGS